MACSDDIVSGLPATGEQADDEPPPAIVHNRPARIAAGDVEIHSCLIKGGDPVVVHNPTVKRDPERFSGNPEEIDLRRPASGQMAICGAHALLRRWSA